jgi:hypothetical protein
MDCQPVALSVQVQLTQCALGEQVAHGPDLVDLMMDIQGEWWILISWCMLSMS